MGLAAQAGVLLLRLALDLVGLLAFAVAALAVFLALWEGHVATRSLVVAALLATLLVRVVAIVGRFLLAPANPALRLLPFDDATARRIQAGLVRLAVVYAVGQVLILDLLELMGAPREVLFLPVVVLGLVFAGLFIHLVWQNRASVAALIRGTGDPGLLRRTLAEAWPALMTGYVGIIFVAMVVEELSGRQLGGHAGIISLLIVIILPLIDMTLCRVLPTAVGWRRAGAAEGQAASTREAYEPVLRQGIHIMVTVLGLLLLARTWGLDLFSLAKRSVGERLAPAVVDISVTLLVVYVAWQLLKTAIDRRLAQEAPPESAKDMGSETGGAGGSRARTLLPLIRMFLFISLCVMATLIILASVGINITPLLAGAGVVGLAVGFGSQALVRDITSGLFFLIDDAFRVGEYIDVGDVKGTVEKISVRSMQLRHHRGLLNTVPYGGIRRLINYSRDWAIMKLDFRLTYDTDLMKVKKILKRIGQEMTEDPEIGPNLLEPLKSQGVTKAEDSALIVRAKFKAKPEQQFIIRREAYARVLNVEGGTPLNNSITHRRSAGRKGKRLGTSVAN
jgi:small-conductance mechanosensitive channel